MCNFHPQEAEKARKAPYNYLMLFPTVLTCFSIKLMNSSLWHKLVLFICSDEFFFCSVSVPNTAMWTLSIFTSEHKWPQSWTGALSTKGCSYSQKKKKTGLFFQTPPQKPKPRLSIKLVWYANSKHSAMAWYLWCKSSTTLKEISANEGLLTRKVLWNVNSIYVFCSTSRKRDEAYKMKMNTSHYLSTAVVIRGHHRTSSASFKTH